MYLLLVICLIIEMGGITFNDYSFLLQFKPNGTYTSIWKSSKIYSNPTSFIDATMPKKKKKILYIQRPESPQPIPTRAYV